MVTFRKSLIIALVIGFSSASFAQGFRAQPASRFIKVRVAHGAEISTKTFREWKNEKIQNAQTRISNLKTRMDLTKQSRQIAQGDSNTVSPKTTEASYLTDSTLVTLEKQLQQEQYAIELAQDLSMTDYFVGYLTKLPNQQKAIQEVSSRLSVEEVADLMLSYSKMFPANSEAANTP